MYFGKHRTTSDSLDIAIIKDRIFPRKACPKLLFLSKQMLVTDVVIGKYIEEVQSLKLQHA